MKEAARLRVLEQVSVAFVFAQAQTLLTLAEEQTLKALI
jgi:hypothetical protein